MSRYKVVISGLSTDHLHVLSSEQMTALFKQYQGGDAQAKEELICGNLKLVLSIVQRFAARCDNMDDLFQVGCIGLVKAIDHFDLSHQVRFSTYAVPMIMGRSGVTCGIIRSSACPVISRISPIRSSGSRRLMCMSIRKSLPSPGWQSSAG